MRASTTSSSSTGASKVQAGNPLETVERRPEPVASFGAQIPVLLDLIVDLPGEGDPRRPGGSPSIAAPGGVRAGRVYAYLLDWCLIAVYDGGWLEWSKNPAGNAIEVGEDALAAA